MRSASWSISTRNVGTAARRECLAALSTEKPSRPRTSTTKLSGTSTPRSSTIRRSRSLTVRGFGGRGKRSTRPRLACRPSGKRDAAISGPGAKPMSAPRSNRYEASVEAELLRGLADRGRIEVGALDEDVAGRLGDARGLAADDPGQGDRPRLVGDDEHLGRELEPAAVEVDQRLAPLGLADDDAAAADPPEVERVDGLGRGETDVHSRRRRC